MILKSKSASRHAPESQRVTSASHRPPAIPPSISTLQMSSTQPVDASPNSKAALWRINTELRQSNQQLERELQSLRQVEALRRLTRSSSGLSSRRSSMHAMAAEASQEKVAGLEVALQEALAEAEASQEKVAGLEAALQEARAETAVAQAGIAVLSKKLHSAQAEAEELLGLLGAAQDGFAAAQELLAAKQVQVQALALEAEEGRAEAMGLRKELEAGRAALEAAQQQLAKRQPEESQAVGASTLPDAAPVLPAAEASTPSTSRPCSRAEYAQHQTAAPLEQIITQVFSVVLPPAEGGEQGQDLVGGGSAQDRNWRRLHADHGLP